MAIFATTGIVYSVTYTGKKNKERKHIMMALLLGWVGSVYHDVWDAFAVRFVHTPTYGVLLEQCYPTRLCLLKWYPTDNFINKGNNRTTIAGTHIGLPYPCVRG